MAKNGTNGGKKNGGENRCDERDVFCRIRDAFGVFARKTSTVLGSAWAFVIAILIIVVWAMTGPAFHYSDTWQLIINTGTTIVTFLMVFLMQNTQNRDTAAIQLKLDELIRANAYARNGMLALEDLSEEQMDRLKATFARLAVVPDAARETLRDVREELAEAGEKVDQAQEKIEDLETGVAVAGHLAAT